MSENYLASSLIECLMNMQALYRLPNSMPVDRSTLVDTYLIPCTYQIHACSTSVNTSLFSPISLRRCEDATKL